MKIKVGFIIIGMILIGGFFPQNVHADIGPKPSVHITFDGIKDEVYYVTLLSREESTGPYSFTTEPISKDSSLVDEYQKEDMEAWKAFRNYKDTDGYYFLEYFERNNQKNTFEWNYHPPSTFKILIYFPKDKRFVVSETFEKYAFDSYYKVSLSKMKTILNVKKHYNYTIEIISLIVRILLTIAIEMVLALMFGLRKKKMLLFILMVNVSTQILLNLLLNMINYKYGRTEFIFNYIWMELLVILIEAVVYSCYFKKISLDKPIKKGIVPLYTIVSNGVSFFIGLVVSFLIPGFF